MCYTTGNMSFRTQRLYFVLIGLFICLTAPLLAYGATLSDVTSEISSLTDQIAKKKSAIDQLEKSIADTKASITKKQTEGKSLKNQLSILDNQIKTVQLNIEVTEDKLDALNLEIRTLQINIGQKENTISRQKVIIAELLRNLAHNSDQSYVQILASYNSFSDLYNELHSLQTVESDVGKSVKSIRLAKEDLQVRKQQTEEKKAEVAVLEDQLQQQKKDLDEQSANKQHLLAQTQSSEKVYTALLTSLKSQYQQTENEISSIEQQVRSKLTEKQRLELLQGADATKLSWPVPSHYITAYFHDPDYPFRYIFEHPAIDIRAAQGTVVRAAASGYVAQARHCTLASCYAYVMIIHNDGISTVYGHLSRIDVAIDQFVNRGDAIGLSGGRPGTVGAGPFVTGPHLHFEVRKNGIPNDPQLYLIP